jgi:molybdopterin-dependent oxidoreductase alpha subunit
MGIHEKPGAEFLDALSREFAFAAPRAHGVDVVGAIEAMLDGRIRALIAMGGNFALATPDSERTQAALRRLELSVQISTKLNRSHLVHGQAAYILPTLGRSEIDRQANGVQAVTVEDSMSMVHLSRGMKDPASPTLRSEPAIVAGLARATLPRSNTPWTELSADYDRIRERIARVVPGFHDFNRRVRVAGGFHLEHPGRRRVFPTPSGRALLIAHELEAEAAPRSDAPFLLTTLRSHDQYNTTVYGYDDRYRGVRGLRRVCFIAGSDIQRLGLAAGALVDLISLGSDGERVVRGFTLVEYAIPAGCVASYFPETNALVPLDHVSEHSGTPASKSIPVRLAPSAPGTVAS